MTTRTTYQAEGLIDGGAGAFLIETSQNLLQAKAAVNGCKQAIVSCGVRLPIFVEVTVETTGTMLMGSEIGAALTALEPLGVDAIGLNCAAGPDSVNYEDGDGPDSRFARIMPLVKEHGTAVALTID